jgi:hypothetical protein
MWQEGDNAVGDLLKSPVLGPVDRMNDPVPVHNWWADHGIVVSSSELNALRCSLSPRSVARARTPTG